MSNVEKRTSEEGQIHQKAEEEVTPLGHKSLSRNEIAASPEYQKSIKSAADAPVQAGTWDERAVCDRDKLITRTKANHQQIILDDLLLLGSIKFFERAKEYWKHKGRICYCGDSAEDQDGAYAVNQQLSAFPRGLHGANSNLCYGCVAEHKTACAHRPSVQESNMNPHSSLIATKDMVQQM